MGKENHLHFNESNLDQMWEQTQEAERQRRLTRFKEQGFEVGKAYGLQEEDRQVTLRDDGDFYRVSDGCPVYDWVATNSEKWWMIRFFDPIFDGETGEIKSGTLPVSFFQEMGP